MKVLVLAPRFYGLGGAERYARQFTAAIMAGRGSSSVRIWSYLSGDAADDRGRSSYLGEVGDASSPLRKVRFAARALRYAQDAQLIIACHISVAPVAYLCALRYGVPYVVIAYGIDVWGHQSPLRVLALRHAVRIVSLSRFTAERLRADHGIAQDKLTVIEPVVDADLLRSTGEAEPARAVGGKVLLTVARLAAAERYKGCDTVIRVLPVVHRAAGPVRYVIAGDGDDRPRLEALVRESGMTDLVQFLGRVEGPALARVYAGCDIFVMPARAGFWERRWRGEGFGIVFIEAAAFAKPAVAGGGDGSREAVMHGQTGLVVDADQDDAVAGALLTLLRNDGLRIQMGQAARRRVEEYFVASRMERQVQAMLSELLPG